MFSPWPDTNEEAHIYASIYALAYRLWRTQPSRDTREVEKPFPKHWRWVLFIKKFRKRVITGEHVRTSVKNIWVGGGGGGLALLHINNVLATSIDTKSLSLNQEDINSVILTGGNFSRFPGRSPMDLSRWTVDTVWRDARVARERFYRLTTDGCHRRRNRRVKRASSPH